MGSVRNACLVVCCTMITLWSASPAGAATIQVDTNADDGTDCTLRNALDSASANADEPGCAGTGDYGDDIVTFAPSVTGNIQLLGAQLVIDGSGTLDVVGPGSNVLDVVGANPNRVLYVSPSRTATVSGLTFRGGDLQVSGPEVPEGVVGAGGGIANYGNLTLEESSIESNAVNVVGTDPGFARPQATGGGIYSEGQLTIRRSTVAGNTATSFANVPEAVVASADGGGIFARGATQVSDSTISGNLVTAIASSEFSSSEALASGGGVFVFRAGATIQGTTIAGNTAEDSDPFNTSRAGGVGLMTDVSDTVTLKGDTITGNSAETASNVIKDGGLMTAENTVLADPAGGGANCATVGVNTDPASLGHNLSEDTSCGFAGAGDIQGVDPNLLPLADNGGPTMTRLPAPPSVGSPSPLIDAGLASGLTSDQRGLSRTQDFDVANGTGGDSTDIGSVEVQGASVTGISPASPSDSPSPVVSGTAEATSPSVQVYADAACGAVVGSPTTPALFASPGVMGGPVAPNTATPFRARSTYGTLTSLCGSGLTFVRRPTVPVLTGVAPASPANDNSPRITGSADPGSAINIYTTPDCTGTVAGTGNDTDLSGSGIAVSVPDNSTTTFYAKAVSNGGSDCSTGVTYTEATPAAQTPVPPVAPGTPVAPADTPKKKCKRAKAKPKNAGAAAKKRCKGKKPKK